MTAYILKTVLSSLLLLIIYFLFFEKEKMHRFKRFYLLFSILFSFVIPFITFQSKSSTLPIAQTINEANEQVEYMFSEPSYTPINNSSFFPNLFFLLYGIVTAFFLYRFIKNVIVLISKIRNNKSVVYFDARLILMQDTLLPHSFLKYIFINKEAFEKGIIEKEILQHELAHVRQKHSMDILLLELLLVFAWLNPVLFLYRKAIQLNHEFLADEAVVNTFGNPNAYQRLLFDNACKLSGFLLSSPFNYFITKKRLIMLTKKTPHNIVILKGITIVPILAAMVLFFAAKTSGQDAAKQDKRQLNQDTSKPAPWVTLAIGSTKEGVSKELMEEYNEIVNKYKTGDDFGWWKNMQKNITIEDRNRLETIYKQMNIEQQKMQTVHFRRPLGPLKRSVPTKQQFESFKNPKIYGVWINDKKVSNSVLNKYINTDFAQFDVSKLYGPAKKNVSYYYQVDMMTKDYYQDYYDRITNDKSSHMVFSGPRKTRNN